MKLGMICRREEEDCGNIQVTPDGKLALKESMRRKYESAMVEAFKSSFAFRRKWSEEIKPMVVEIFERFPRYRDLQQAVSRHSLILFEF